LITRYNKENLEKDETTKIISHNTTSQNERSKMVPVFWKKLLVPINPGKVHVYDNEPVYIFNLEVSDLNRMWMGFNFKLKQIENDEHIPYEITDDWIESNESIEIVPIARLFSICEAEDKNNALLYGPTSVQWMIRQ
jgi:hypothetical protein